MIKYKSLMWQRWKLRVQEVVYYKNGKLKTIIELMEAKSENFWNQQKQTVQQFIMELVVYLQ